MGKLIRYIKYNTEAIVVLLSTFFVFYYIFIKSILPETCIDYISDIPLHSDEMIKKIEARDFFSGNFLVYLLTIMLSGFSLDLVTIGRSLCFLLASAECATYLILKRQFSNTGKSRLRSAALSLSILLVFTIPYLYYLNILSLVHGTFSANMYLTHYVPTVWHNSTIIFSMPFSLGIFLLSERVLKEFQRNDILKICILVAIDVLIKPSFFFIFLVSFPIVAFVRYRFSKEFLSSLFPVAIGLVCLAYVYISIYTNTSDGSSVIIDFNRLLQLDTYGWYKVLSSIVFPVLFLAFNWNSIEKGESLLYIFLLLSSAIGISLVCAELGPRAEHGNMCWQTIPAMQITYFAILRHLVTQKPATNYDKITKCTFSTIFAIHVVSGIWYLARYIITGTYY